MKKYPFVAVLSLIACTLFGQRTFERLIDLPGNDWGTYIIRDTSTGNYAIASTFGTFEAGKDYALLLVDTCGKLNSVTPFGGTSNDYSSNLLLDSTKYVLYGRTTSSIFGTYLVGINPSYTNYFRTVAGGYSTGEEGNFVIRKADSAAYLGFGSTQSYGSGGFDMYLIEYSLQGAANRAYTIGTDSMEHGYCIQNTSDNGLVMVGWTDYRGYKKDVYVVKFDSTYSMEWNRIIGTNKQLDEVGYHIIEVTQSGKIEYMIAGYREREYTTADDSTVITRDVLVMNLDKNGYPQWARSYGGNEDEEGKQIVEYESGYGVTGYTESFGAGKKDAFVMGINASGLLSWGSCYGDSLDDYANSLVLTWEQDGFMVVGASKPFDSTFSSNVNTYLFRTDLAGRDPCVTDTFGGVYEMQVEIDSAGEVRSGVRSNATGWFPEIGYKDTVFCDQCADSLKGPGNNQYKRGLQGHMQTDLESDLGVALYPNPTTGELYISLDKTAGDVVEISILSPAGVVVFRQKLGDNEVASTEVIKLPSTLSNGLYFVQLTGTEAKETVPFILSR